MLEASLTARMTSIATSTWIRLIKPSYTTSRPCTLFHTWPEDRQSHLDQAWQAIHNQLQDKQYPWYTVRGPTAATITYMMEWNWQVHTLHRWTRAANDYLLENETSLQDPWWKVERALLLEAKQQSTARLAQQPHHQHLITGLDWHNLPASATHPSSGSQATSEDMGARRPSTIRKADSPNSVPSATFRPLPSTSFGCANGTINSSTNQCLRHGRSGYSTMTKNLYGVMGGYHLNHKSSALSTGPGKTSKHLRHTSTKAGLSPSMPHRRPMTLAASSGCLAFVSTT